MIAGRVALLAAAGGAPYRVIASGESYNASTDMHSITLSSGIQVGDLIVVYSYTNWPSYGIMGYSSVVSSSALSNSGRLGVYAKTAVSGDAGATIYDYQDFNGRMGLAYVAIRSTEGTLEVINSAVSAADTTSPFSTPTLTNAGLGGIGLTVYISDEVNTGTTNVTIPSGYTASTSVSGNPLHLAAAYKLLGASESVTGDWTNDVSTKEAITASVHVAVNSGGLPALPTTDLASVWWFEEGSGTSVTDDSGNSITGTISTTNGTWTSEGYYLPDGNITHSNSYGSTNHTVVIAFKHTNPTTSDSRWLWGWSVGGIRLGLHHSTGTLLYPYGLVRVNGVNVTQSHTGRYIDAGEWVLVAMTAEANGNLTVHTWADGTRYDVSKAIGTPIDSTDTTFRLKGSNDPELTIGAVAHYTRAMNTTELEEVVDAIRARVEDRSVSFA